MNSLKIRFAQNDPILIQFIIDEEVILAPAMLTDTIDEKWQERKKE